MKIKYFILKDNKKDGPFTLEELRKVDIFEQDLIWHNNIDTWTEAKNFAELSDILIVKPPKTKPEILQDKITTYNTLLEKQVKTWTLVSYISAVLLTTIIAFNNTNDFIRNSKGRMYYFSNSIFTRTINAVFDRCTIEGGEYDSEATLFFNLLLSSALLFLFISIPVAFIYYKKHKMNYNDFTKN